MNILSAIVYITNIIKELLDFVFNKIQEFEKEKEKSDVDKLKEQIEKDLDEGKLKEINDRIKIIQNQIN